MEYLAIKGDQARGNDIISLFEGFGAKNIWGYKGKCEAWAYFIGPDRIIMAIPESDIRDNPRFVIFDYDTFKSRYPLKVGDNICVPGDFDSGRIVDLDWNFKYGDMMYKIDVKDLQAKYPVVADIQALRSDKQTVDEICILFARQLIKRLKGTI